MSLTYNERIYNTFYKHDIIFLSNIQDLKSESLYSMMNVFDVFYFNEGYLWYRIKENFKGCIIDKQKRLRKKYNSYRIYVIQLFEGDNSIKNIRTEDYVEESEFHKYRDRGLLSKLLYDEFESDISLSSSYSSIISDYSED